MSKASHWLKSFFTSIYWLLYFKHWKISDVFDDLYAGQDRGQVLRGIFRDVFGDEFAEEVDPTGFLAMSELRTIAERLEVGEGKSLVDLACGLGGAGLWVARETGARLIGVDISPNAVEKARRRIDSFGLAGRAEFRVGDFAATELPGEAFDGAMSTDSLFLVPDRTGSIRETARLLRRGARFLCTTWELNAAGGIKDYRPLLKDAGFEVEAYDESPGWEARQRTVYERILAEQPRLIEDMGKATAMVWVRDAQAEMPRLPKMRRVLITARKV
ncbi:MAG TPA: class I SAM-dependent methyltransferase [Thermoguttaceae bacterium]|nr:class I SAM-dependent methyltransferase [Thermoguttaceae bacterium]